MRLVAIIRIIPFQSDHAIRRNWKKKKYPSCNPPYPNIQVQVISSHANVKTVGYLHLMELSVVYHVLFPGEKIVFQFEENSNFLSYNSDKDLIFLGQAILVL